MKTIPSLILAALLTLLPACATYKQTAGKLLASTALTVDAAMRSWATVVKMGKATDDQQAKVRSAYEQYQLAMQAAEAAYVVLTGKGERGGWLIASSE